MAAFIARAVLWLIFCFFLSDIIMDILNLSFARHTDHVVGGHQKDHYRRRWLKLTGAIAQLLNINHESAKT